MWRVDGAASGGAAVEMHADVPQITCNKMRMLGLFKISFSDTSKLPQADG